MIKMKITKSQLKQIIKEELEKALREVDWSNPLDRIERSRPTPEQVWESDSGGPLRDLGEVRDWLNAASRAFDEWGYSQIGDENEAYEVRDGLDKLGVSLPIEDLETALKVFHYFAGTDEAGLKRNADIA